jgi:hypothetical protein
MEDDVAVLTDFITDKPKLLSVEIISEIFMLQRKPQSPSIDMLLALKPAWRIVAGPIADDAVNYGLGVAMCKSGREDWTVEGNAGVWWVNREMVLRVSRWMLGKKTSGGNIMSRRMIYHGRRRERYVRLMYSLR